MSLRRIVLRDFVIVPELELEFGGGFTVLTGETGAGKSILIDALQFVLGSRSEAGIVREGSPRAEVGVEFDATPSIGAWLQEAGFDVAPLGEPVLLRRTMDAQSKSRAWINGSPATATQLRALADALVDIHGQHAWQSLTRPQAVRDLLDAYAGLSTPLPLLWQQWRERQQALADAQAAQATLQQERERLLWQIGELDRLAPGADEWDELNTQHTRLGHAQALLETTQQALQVLDEDETSALTHLTRALDLLQNHEHIEPEFKVIGEVLASCQAQLQDAVHSLNGYLRRAEPDPERWAELDERMSLWLSLARRYKRSPEGLPELLAQWRSELAQLDASADLAALAAAEQGAAKALNTEADRVSQVRRKAAPKLSLDITRAMQTLGMEGGRFEVSLQALPTVAAHGREDVVFLVAGHAGSTPRPVAKVASGGELSRIALAIAVTTSQLGEAGTLIFDEVDAGVGGVVAQTVGRMMQQLGRDRQVFAVTHLPQVAACADHHYRVAKQRAGESTVSQVEALEGEQRVAELARMLGGVASSETTLAHAKEMLERA